MATQSYRVEAERNTDLGHITARVRNFELELGARRGDLSAGFNPVETLLSALAACLAASLGMVAELSRVKLEAVSISVAATRQDKPPVLTDIHYQVNLASPADDTQLKRLVSLAERNSTVLTTLRQAVKVRGEWQRLEMQTHA